MPPDRPFEISVRSHLKTARHHHQRQSAATSANLGVGYDCLGLALDDFATVTFEVIAEGLEIAGCEEAYCNEENLFYQAFVKGLQYMGESVSGIRITVDTDIPYARGLGSSATCIVAGLAGRSCVTVIRIWSSKELSALLF